MHGDGTYGVARCGVSAVVHFENRQEGEVQRSFGQCIARRTVEEGERVGVVAAEACEGGLAAVGQRRAAKLGNEVVAVEGCPRGADVEGFALTHAQRQAEEVLAGAGVVDQRAAVEADVRRYASQVSEFNARRGSSRFGHEPIGVRVGVVGGERRLVA